MYSGYLEQINDVTEAHMVSNLSRIILLTCKGATEDSYPDLFAPNSAMVGEQRTFLLLILFYFSHLYFFLPNSESVLCPSKGRVPQALNSHKSCLFVRLALSYSC